MENEEDDFELEFGTPVHVKRSGESGTVTGIAMHMRNTEIQYFVEYVSANGEAVEAWFFKSQLEVAD